jgi:rod shape-determining protein MreC
MRFRQRYRAPLLIGCTLLLIFSIISLGLKRSPVLQKSEAVMVSLTAPLLSGLHHAGHGIGNVFRTYFFLVGAAKENADLKKRLAEVSQKEAQYQEALKSQVRLESLLGLKREVGVPVTGARVIAYDPSFWSRAVLLDQGKKKGVDLGMPILAPAGVVGRIIKSYPNYSKAMLILDRNSAADAMIQRSRVRGILQGNGGNRCSLEYVPKRADVKEGDVVLSSSLGGVYPKGLVFGHVTQVNQKGAGIFQEIEVTPEVDFSTLEEVLVVKSVSLALQP